MKSAAPESTSIKGAIMLKLVKHAVALAFVIAAAGAPVAAHADMVSLNFTHVVVTHSVQDEHSDVAVQPR
jgi:hypothetical protein